MIDTTFNAQLQTTSLSSKSVNYLLTQPDGKTLAAGNFNTYNGQSVGGLIRLNADASLDTTFNNDLITPGSSTPRIIFLQPDGKILIYGNFAFNNGNSYTNAFKRLNSDGTVDNSFQSGVLGNIYEVKPDTAGRFVVLGDLQIVVNGNTVNRQLVRLNSDGSVDLSFNPPTVQSGIDRITLQNNKIVYKAYDPTIQQGRAYRLNEDGSGDSSFNSTVVGSFQILQMITQPDNKILLLADNRVFRINENGGDDSGFQVTNFPGQPRRIMLQSNGKITIAHDSSSPYASRIVRYNSNGTSDTSFTPYLFPGGALDGHDVQIDGGVILGDQGIFSAPNRFMRLLPTGAADTTFNPGGSGFQYINPGKVRTINVLGDEKILVGGDFDRVGSVNKPKIARLNADSSLDNSFQINTTASGNYFSQITDVYKIAVQTDGKLIVSGSFYYVIGGVQRPNLVRLNPNGSIDPTFELSLYVADWFVTGAIGQNKPTQMADGKILVGTTRTNLTDTTPIPLLLSSSGVRDTSFNPTVHNTKATLSITDTDVQADGKILISGRHTSGGINDFVLKGFIVRLNADGSLDSSFQAAEITDRAIFVFKKLPSGKILIVSHSQSQSNLFRLNADGSLDNTFNAGSGANGKINAMAILNDNSILVGGAFSNFNNQPRQNLAMLDADGNLANSPGNTNREVLCITIDNQGRVLIGGEFTSITVGSQSANIPYLLRLNLSLQPETRPYFDFDGDGKTDISIFRANGGEWWYQKSSNDGNAAFQFGSQTDKLVPADFTGDGKTDIAFFRPSSGQWFVLRSEDLSFYAFPFGAAGDVPVPADYDGDSKADAAVFRESSLTWFINKSSGGTDIISFGAVGDKPVVGDYDGDGKTDIAIFRANGATGAEWWIRKSSDGNIFALTFGTSADKPVQGDFTGDGKTDIAFFRPLTGEWFILRSEDLSFYSFPFGTNGDVPVPGDYDGDGRFDAGVFRSATSNWFVQRSTAGTLIQQFGISGDVPVPNVFVP